MAQQSPSDLAVTFTRDGDGDLTLTFIAADGGAALDAARRILDMQDALHAGDKLTVERHRRPNLTQRGLA